MSYNCIICNNELAYIYKSDMFNIFQCTNCDNELIYTFYKNKISTIQFVYLKYIIVVFKYSFQFYNDLSYVNSKHFKTGSFEEIIKIATKTIDNLIFM